MKALAKTKPGKGLEIIDAPLPTLGEGEVLIKVHYASICGSDLHAYRWDEWGESTIKEFPRILGHEVAGEVVEVSEGVQGIAVGDFVALESHIWCGECYQCKLGNYHVCQNMKILGFDIDGGFAEYVKIPYRNAIKVPSNIPRRWVSLMEPMGNAVDTVLSEDISARDVLIVGAGPIGIMATAISKVSGAHRVIVSDVKDVRLDIAKRMGADFVVNPLKENLYEKVMDITHGKGVDVVLEMSGSSQGLKDGLNVIRAGGRLSMLGLFSEPFVFDFNTNVIMKGIRIYGIIGRRIYSTWFKTMNLLERIELEPIIGKYISLDEFEQAFEELIQGRYAKIVFRMV